MNESSAAAIIAADKIKTLDVLTSDRWTENRELTAYARSVIAHAFDAFAAQAVAAERAKPAVSDLERARLAYQTIDAFGWTIYWKHEKAIPDDAWPIDIIAKAIAEAVSAERERCAQVVESHKTAVKDLQST